MMRFFARNFLAGIFILCIAVACTSGEEDERLAASKAPQFALKDLKGNTLRLEDLKGRVVLLNFFATWCGPCRLEIPEFVKLHKRFKNEGLEIVGISLDMEGGAVLNPFVESYGIPYPIVIGTRQVVEDYGGIRGIPTSFLVDRDGSIAREFIGMYPAHVLEASVSELLARKG